MCWSESAPSPSRWLQLLSSDLNPLNFARCFFSFLHVGVRGPSVTPFSEHHPPGHPERLPVLPRARAPGPPDLESSRSGTLLPVSVPDLHLRTPAVPLPAHRPGIAGSRVLVTQAVQGPQPRGYSRSPAWATCPRGQPGWAWKPCGLSSEPRVTNRVRVGSPLSELQEPEESGRRRLAGPAQACRTALFRVGKVTLRF